MATFDTSNMTLRKLLGNGLSYRVPPFQQDYSGSSGEWEDLWLDIVETLEADDESVHYMGYLVLQSGDQRNFDVIDGQQRLATLSLLVLAVLHELTALVEAGLAPDDNVRRIEQLRGSYLGYLDPVSLATRSKLTLNRNNDPFYQDYLVPLRESPSRNLRASERLLRRALEWFIQRITDYFGEPSTESGKDLARFVDKTADKLLFTVITVKDELNAFKVFETLNARGVRLAPTDLLKNYVFSVVAAESTHEAEISSLERRWAGLVGGLGERSFTRFLRAHWNSRRPFVRETNLFKRIRSETPDRNSAFALLHAMEDDVHVYAALHDSSHEAWTPQQREYVRELSLFRVRQPWPLLLAAHRALDEGGMSELLRACSVISFRYNVVGQRAPGEQERVYTRVANGIANNQLETIGEVIHALDPVYVPDEAFQSDFANLVLRTTSSRNTKVVRYILFRLEAHLSGVAHDEESAKYSVEHVLPENPGDQWPGFSDEQADAFVYRLGNMTLLPKRRNRDLANSSFMEKKPVYASSEFRLTQRIATENDEWNADRVARHQAWMARQATSVWRIAQLS